MPIFIPVSATVIANSVNPILAILLLGAPYFTPRRTSPWEFWLRSALGIGHWSRRAFGRKRQAIWSLAGPSQFPQRPSIFRACRGCQPNPARHPLALALPARHAADVLGACGSRFPYSGRHRRSLAYQPALRPTLPFIAALTLPLTEMADWGIISALADHGGCSSVG